MNRISWRDKQLSKQAAEIETLRKERDSAFQTWKEMHIATLDGFIKQHHEPLKAEIERLNEVIRLTYKMNCGRGYEHLELPEAVAAVRKKDWDEIERLRSELEIEKRYVRDYRDGYCKSCSDIAQLRMERDEARKTMREWSENCGAEVQRLRGLLRWWLNAGGADEATIHEALGDKA